MLTAQPGQHRPQRPSPGPARRGVSPGDMLSGRWLSRTRARRLWAAGPDGAPRGPAGLSGRQLSAPVAPWALSAWRRCLRLGPGDRPSAYHGRSLLSPDPEPRDEITGRLCNREGLAEVPGSISTYGCRHARGGCTEDNAPWTGTSGLRVSTAVAGPPTPATKGFATKIAMSQRPNRPGPRSA